MKAAAALALITWLGPAAVRAEAIGVVITGSAADVGLADNVAEVAMARLAEVPGRTLVGAAELRRRLGPAAGPDLADCLERPACTGRLGVSTGVTRVLAGAVRSETGGYYLSLSRVDIAEGRTGARFYRRVDGPLPLLLRAVQEGVDQLLDPALAPGRLRIESVPEGSRVTVDDLFLGTTPLISGSLPPGPHRVRVERERHFAYRSTVTVPPGRDLKLSLQPEDLPARLTWPRYAAFGTAGAAIVCVAAGLVFGQLAQVSPMGDTREDAQRDLERRRTYGHVSTGLFIGGAVLGATSAFVFTRFWRHVAGD